MCACACVRAGVCTVSTVRRLGVKGFPSIIFSVHVNCAI